ncbi:enhancer of polycomb-like protein [Paragonimus westermani]|uniref:Enhancer of polycomb-like protein n=1 Tax=Paragonimus westermani TaxID=34504 RepID=A0A5J4NML0_9TREM|nr:enhancer of polycomb-like protein [Paragonimus westermani]
MSKVSFRARQIDFNKPLPILKNGSDLLTEFTENALVNRGVPQIPSGMEKEEENEHHFVEVIQALQLRTVTDVKIPVPDIIDRSVFYKQLYSNEFHLPKQLVHIRTVVLAEDEPTDYDMDTDDEEWLSKSQLGITPQKFESMIDRLERGCGQKEAKCLLRDDPSLVIAIYDYWLNKRVQSRQPLLYSVRQEKRDSGSNADPYVAFRRRSEKMQTRKNRKNDEQSYEKMLMLRDQMDQLGFVRNSSSFALSKILSGLVRREAYKEAIIHCDLQSLEKRYHLGDWDGAILLEAESLARKPYRPADDLVPHSPKDGVSKRSSRKRKLTHRALNLSVRSEDASDAERTESNSDGPFAFVRLQGCRYLKPRIAPDLRCSDQQPDTLTYPHLRYTLTTVPSVCHPGRQSYTGYIRRRLGRGGRIICDRLRASPEVAAYFSNYDKHVESSFENPDVYSSTHLSSKPFESKDQTLLRRLQSLVLSTRRCQPSFQWPICTEIPSTSPSFEPLCPCPWPLSSASSNPFTMTSPTASELPPPAKTSEKEGVASAKTSSLLNFNGLHRSLRGGSQATAQFHHSIENVELHDISRRNLLKRTKSVTPPSGGTQQTLLSITDNNVAPAPHRLWRKLARPYDAIAAFKPPEFPRSRGAVAPISNVNGLGPQLLHPSDDRLRLSDSSVLSSSKMCCIARDCISVDPSVPGPQLQTANSVSQTQFCQLPT